MTLSPLSFLARLLGLRPEKFFGERRGLKTKVRDLKEYFISSF